MKKGPFISHTHTHTHIHTHPPHSSLPAVGGVPVWLHSNHQTVIRTRRTVNCGGVRTQTVAAGRGCISTRAVAGPRGQQVRLLPTLATIFLNVYTDTSKCVRTFTPPPTSPPPPQHTATYTDTHKHARASSHIQTQP